MVLSLEIDNLFKITYLASIRTFQVCGVLSEVSLNSPPSSMMGSFYQRKTGHKHQQPHFGRWMSWFLVKYENPWPEVLSKTIMIPPANNRESQATSLLLRRLGNLRNETTIVDFDKPPTSLTVWEAVHLRRDSWRSGTAELLWLSRRPCIYGKRS